VFILVSGKYLIKEIKDVNSKSTIKREGEEMLCVSDSILNN
jgi:hypothetical protein